MCLSVARNESDSMTATPRLRWRTSQFGEQLDLVVIPADGGPEIWFGTIGPVTDGHCLYNSRFGASHATTQGEARVILERAAKESGTT